MTKIPLKVTSPAKFHRRKADQHEEDVQVLPRTVPQHRETQGTMITAQRPDAPRNSLQPASNISLRGRQINRSHTIFPRYGQGKPRHVPRHQLYAHDRPVYVYQLPRFDSKLTYPTCSVGRLRLNLYVTNPGCDTYHADFYQHLRLHGYTPSESDPCLYYKHPNDASTIAGIAIDTVLVLVPSILVLQAFKRALQLKCGVKDL